MTEENAVRSDQILENSTNDEVESTIWELTLSDYDDNTDTWFFDEEPDEYNLPEATGMPGLYHFDGELEGKTRSIRVNMNQVRYAYLIEKPASQVNFEEDDG